MSSNETLQAKLISRMGLQNSSQQVQDAIIRQIAIAARGKIANAAQDILNDQQQLELEAKIAEAQTGDQFDEIAAWIEHQIPSYNELFLATIEDIVDEIIEMRQQVENA